MKSDNLNISFTGEFRNSIDQKNRLSIPAKYRKALSPINDNTFVLTRGFDQCLILYPLDEWKKVEGQLGSLSSIKVRHRNFVRSIVRCAIHIKYDSQGRIAIPDNLLQHAKIDSNVVVIGMIKKIEIWSPDLMRITKIWQMKLIFNK
jgi:MraZ protein